MQFKCVTATLLLSLLMQRIDGFVFSNAMDGDMNFQCPPHKYISYVGGHHDNSYEDRQYEFRCTTVPFAEASLAQETCDWTASYVNNFDEPVIFECSNNGYLSGVHSVHDNHYEDRRFKFYCCRTPGYHMDDCEYSGPVNQYDGPMAYTVPTNKVMKGAVSIHDNGHEDRVWDWEVCTMVTHQ
ncbi:hypothetical protein ACJMK2_031798 [Sinanodonta woodiana]|uniref:Dermatopontin n=1 Tax=Sinanodonta woodiana TaxID=1069815 RepID=A0ABD3X399_SINWO